MYKKLLLKSQGGIIDEIHRSAQDNCAVVAIGLGGTGVSCLKNLKAKVFNRVIPDDPDSAVPRYDHIKFLAVDSDRTGLVSGDDASMQIDQINMDTEYLDISYPGDIVEMFKTMGSSLNNSSIYKEWLNHDRIDVTTAKTGACGVRQIGRYLFIQKANEFVTKVQNLITDAKRGLTNPKVYIHIFSGIGGGTGAGTFLDACYLVQKALGNEGTNAFTCGYFFLPDVNLARVTDKETKDFIQVNGYASLQELDYCMNFESNEDKWSQRYPGVGLVESSNPPVNICHLISGKNVAGDVIPDAYDYAMNVVTDYFMDFIVKTDAEFTMESHIANYVAKKAMLDKDSGAQYEYCVLGASNAALPFKEVLTYLASRMFEGFASIKKHEPGKASVDEFVRSNGLTFDTLFNMLTSEADMSFPMPDNSYRDAHENDDLTTTYFADIRARVNNMVEKNYSTMTKDIESFDIAFEAKNTKSNNVHASSIITKIFKALYTCITDPAKGPYFTAKLVNGTSGENLISVIDGHIREIDKKISQLECNLGQHERKRKTDQDNFFGSRASRSKYRDYLNSTRNLVIQYTIQETYYTAKDFFNKLRKQLVDLYNRYCLVYNNLINNLIDTFEANKTYLEEIRDKVATFEYPIATINNLKESLDERIKEIDIPKKMEDFQKYMLSADGCKSWMTNNENEISKLVSKYFIELFSEYTNKTMTSYLQDKYNTDKTDELIHCIRNDIMNQLDIKASPLYWPSVLYNSNNASKIGYISVPVTSAEVCQAAANLSVAKPELKVRTTGLMDRITVMRCFVGAPIFGYQPITQYEVMALNDNQYGKHLYEGREYVDDNGNVVKGRDWRCLPSITPLSKMNKNNAGTLIKFAEKAKEVYNKAESLGFIVEVGTGEYVLRTIADSFMDEIISISKDATNKGDAVSLFNASEEIKKKKNNLVFSQKVYHIKNDAKNGQGQVPEPEKKQVRIDHFAFAPNLVKIAESEIEKIDKIDEIIVSLEPKIDSDFEDFANALFTGAVKINGIMLIYENDFYEEVKLSAPNMPMGGMRLYQAFVSFKELDDSTKEKLKSISEKRNAMEDGMDCIINACTNVKVQLDQKNIAMALRIASTKFPANANEIKDFYNNLSSKFDEYTMTYGLAI